MRVCRYCIATKGIKGTDLVKGGEKDLDDDETFFRHLEDEHNIPVRREGETEGQAQERFIREHPKAKNPTTCKCPECKAKRGDGREMLVNSIRQK